MKYEFSIPMMYSKEKINQLIDINRNVDKSEIKTLYFSLPVSNELFTGFEQPRNQLIEFNTFDFWKDLSEYSLSKGFNIIYNLNSARTVNFEKPELKKQLEKLDKLLIELQKSGVNKLRISNIQLLEYILKYYPYFEIYVSTVTNYKTIQEFKNLKLLYPKIKQVIPAQDMNKNFLLLKNIKNKLNLDMEIMCNDGCIQGCINFYNHQAMNNYEENYLKGITPASTCSNIMNMNPFKYLCQTTHVFPWEIEEYGQIGITKFKLTGRDGIKDTNKNSSNYAIDMYYRYLKGIDDVKTLDDFSIELFLNNSRVHERLKLLKGKDVIKFFPNTVIYVHQGAMLNAVIAICALKRYKNCMIRS